jgi:hypothetical protein
MQSTIKYKIINKELPKRATHMSDNEIQFDLDFDSALLKIANEEATQGWYVITAFPRFNDRLKILLSKTTS